MRQSSANLLRDGKREIRSLDSACDPACAMWAFCQNSVPDGSCRGFLLLNGKSENLLNKTLNEDDKIYVQRCVQTVQRGCDPETEKGIAKEVLRFIPHEEPQPKSGFLAMYEAAHSSNPSSEQEPEPESTTRENSGFQAMLSASSEAPVIERHPLIQRQIDFESTLPLICDATCPIKRHCGSFPSNEGSVCVKQNEQFKNKYFVRSTMKNATK